MLGCYSLVRAVCSVIYPAVCVRCDTSILQSGLLCSECWQKVTFVSDVSCRLCRQPMDYTMGSYTQTCGECLIQPPVYDGLYSVFAYDAVMKPLILKFKHADDLALAKSFSQWMSRAVKPVVPEIDTIVAVPLHPFRLLKRKYNQSFILSERISKLINKPVCHGVLIRKTFEQSQKNLSRQQRIKNVSKAFGVNAKFLSFIQGKTILLVDDVMTTGATLNICTELLKKSGAKTVYALTLARVFPDKTEQQNQLHSVQE